MYRPAGDSRVGLGAWLPARLAQQAKSPAVVQAAAAAVKAARRALVTGPPVIPARPSAATQVLTVAPVTAVPPAGALTPTTVTPLAQQPQSFAPSIPASAGGSAEFPVSSGASVTTEAAAEQPGAPAAGGAMMPLLIGAAVLLFLFSRSRG